MSASLIASEGENSYSAQIVFEAAEIFKTCFNNLKNQNLHLMCLNGDAEKEIVLGEDSSNKLLNFSFFAIFSSLGLRINSSTVSISLNFN